MIKAKAFNQGSSRLFSTYLGIVSIMYGNWIAVCTYMIAGINGSYQGIEII